MTVRPIDHGSAEYAAACELRRRFLREPLGLDLTAADVAGEEAQLHFGLFDEQGVLIGGLIGKPDPDRADTVRIRQVVVDEKHRGRGRGRTLQSEAERLLADAGYRRAVLFARPEAAPFYARCGYTPTGVTAELIGFTHREMAKALENGDALATG